MKIHCMENEMYCMVIYQHSAYNTKIREIENDSFCSFSIFMYVQIPDKLPGKLDLGLSAPQKRYIDTNTKT